MQRTRRYRLLTATLLVLAASAAAAAPQGEYYGSGYTIISQAHGNDDLQATVYRQLAPGTVGQALPQLLDGTGWRLADRYAADDRIYRLYDQPLPEHKLRIGPMPLDQALTWIAGEGWALVVDPVNRLVSFEVEARYDARPPRSTLRSPAPARVTDNVDTTTPVYADLPPQGTFPAVQTAPVSPAAAYGASAYHPAVSSPPPTPTESWQSALPQRLAASAQTPRARRSPETRQAVRPATAEAKPATQTRVAAATATSRRHDKTSAKSGDSATTTKTLPAQTAGRTQPAAGQTPGKAVPAASLPTAKKTSTVVQDTKAVTSQAAHQADRKPPAPEKTPDPSAASAVKKAEAHREKSAPAPDKTTTAPENMSAQATAPVKTESAAPVLANPDQAAAATGNNHTAAKPAAATAEAVKTVTAPHAAPADKSITVVGPPPALIAKRTIHTPPQRPTPDTATPPAKAVADAAPAPQSQEAP
ncbi:hypothetical protein [Cardiobacterium hominis]|uniref:hypothetical protein n=1 Tax=Cardiobacterium hominis TaxID=2718 RepID=UPI002491191F|nr:hypothetical protein [Cardiobacterium hominis]